MQQLSPARNALDAAHGDFAWQKSEIHAAI